MSFTHLYLMQGERIEAWFVSQARREYFDVESICQQIHKKNLPSGEMNSLLNIFFTSEAIKIAVSFSKLQCLYAMLLMWDNSKHGLSVA